LPLRSGSLDAPAYPQIIALRMLLAMYGRSGLKPGLYHAGQRYHFARPMPFAELLDLQDKEPFSPD
jgi:hypothetical protein